MPHYEPPPTGRRPFGVLIATPTPDGSGLVTHLKGLAENVQFNAVELEARNHETPLRTVSHFLHLRCTGTSSTGGMIRTSGRQTRSDEQSHLHNLLHPEPPKSPLGRGGLFGVLGKSSAMAREGCSARFKLRAAPWQDQYVVAAVGVEPTSGMKPSGF